MVENWTAKHRRDPFFHPAVLQIRTFDDAETYRAHQGISTAQAYDLNRVDFSFCSPEPQKALDDLLCKDFTSAVARRDDPAARKQAGDYYAAIIGAVKDDKRDEVYSATVPKRSLTISLFADAETDAIEGFTVSSTMAVVARAQTCSDVTELIKTGQADRELSTVHRIMSRHADPKRGAHRPPLHMGEINNASMILMQQLSSRYALDAHLPLVHFQQMDLPKKEFGYTFSSTDTVRDAPSGKHPWGVKMSNSKQPLAAIGSHVLDCFAADRHQVLNNDTAGAVAEMAGRAYADRLQKLQQCRVPA